VLADEKYKPMKEPIAVRIKKEVEVKSNVFVFPPLTVFVILAFRVKEQVK